MRDTDMTDEEFEELLQEEREYWANQDDPERDRREQFQDTYDMYRREY